MRQSWISSPCTWVILISGSLKVSSLRDPWMTRYVKTVSSRRAPTLAVAIADASQAATSSDSSLRTSGFQRTEKRSAMPRKPLTRVPSPAAPSTAGTMCRSTFNAPGKLTSRSLRSQSTDTRRTPASGMANTAWRQSPSFTGRAANRKTMLCLPPPNQPFDFGRRTRNWSFSRSSSAPRGRVLSR